MAAAPLGILTTGINGDLGQAMVKALRLMERPVRIFGCDAAEEGIGAAFVDGFFKVPFAEDGNYSTCIDEICKENMIDAVIPGSESEIVALSRAHPDGKLPWGSVIVCLDAAALALYMDKLECFRRLSQTVELALFADGQDLNEVERMVADNVFPCIVKPRFASGSRDIKIAKNKEQLYQYLGKIEKPVVQQYIDDAYGEFSVGVFACEEFLRAVAFKRELGPVGASWYADNFDQDKDVLQYVFQIAEVAGIKGSFNVQVRKSSRGVRLLEVNPRFSSLVAARAACGFKDLEWSIDTALKIKIGKPDDNYTPIKFRRFFHEMIDFGSGYAGVEQWLPRYAPRPVRSGER